MCDPVTGVAMGASVLGNVLNRKQENDAIKAQNAEERRIQAATKATRDAEARKQNGLMDDQLASVRRAMTEVDPGRVARDAEAAAPEMEARIAQDLPDRPTERTKGVDREVATDINTRTRRARESIAAMAKLSALRTGSMAGSDAIGEATSRVRQIQGQRRGSLDVAGMEASIPAAVVKPDDSFLGDALIMGGQLGGMYGGSTMTADPFAGALARLRGTPGTRPGPAFEYGGRG